LQTRILGALLFACAILTGFSNGAARADSVADFYKGKTITILVPIGPGGTYDFYGRLGAAILEKHLPGNPKAITQLMTGAGGAMATNYLATVAPQDGTFFVSLHGSAPQNQLLETTGIQYDLAKFLMVGQFTPLNSSLTVWRATSPALTIEESKQKEVVLGSTGAGSYQYQLPVLLNALIGTKFKVILGYKSVSEENVAMERGEIHGRGGTLVSWAITEEHWVRENKIAHLVQVGTRRAPGFEDVPLATELSTNPEHKQALDLVSGGSLMGRSLAATPNIPPDRAQALRAAFDKGIKDPEILALAKAWKLDIEPASGEELEAIVKRILSTPKSVVEMVQKTLDTGTGSKRKE
jgi:tripartite-type tricarboxylate transporter receptor subunit TctC